MLQVVDMADTKQVLQADRLIAAREKMKISQAEFARRLDIGAPHYHRIENGVYQPSLGLIVKIARVLDISADYLLGLTDKEEGEPPQVLTPEQEALLRIERAELEIAKAKKAIKKSIEGKRDRS